MLNKKFDDIRHIKGLFDAFLTVIRDISQGYMRISQLYLGHISGINKACLKISQIFLRHISDNYWAYF